MTATTQDGFKNIFWCSAVEKKALLFVGAIFLLLSVELSLAIQRGMEGERAFQPAAES